MATAYQLLKHTVVQFHLLLPTLPEVVVVILQALPVCVELLQAVRVDVLDPEMLQSHGQLAILRSDICGVYEAGRTRSQRNE